MRHLLIGGFAFLLTLCCALVSTRAANASWWSGQPDQSSALPPVLPGPAGAWTITPDSYTVARDAALGAEVLTLTKAGILEGRTRYGGAYELRARVRLQPVAGQYSTAHFSLAQGENAANYLVSLVSHPTWGEMVTAAATQQGKPLHDMRTVGDKADWGADYYAHSISYNLRAYKQILPGWDAEYRQRIEEAMSRLPGVGSKWLDLRVQCRKGYFRAWLDDRLFATSDDPALDPQGTMKVQLSANVQLASLAVQPMSVSDDFLPISLPGYVNARALLGAAAVDAAALPPAGQRVVVGGIPFEFPGINPEGNDHIDVGQSMFRQANAVGYYPSGLYPNGRWGGAAWRDPARIQVRIPQGMYEALYLIAAADGERDSLPTVSAVFYRPNAGFPETFAGRVPLATAKSREATALPVRLTNGKTVNLWLVKIPIDPAKLTAFSDCNIVEIEFTKEMHLYRSYPDPISYDYHPGGLPSGVHIYAATLAQSPVVFTWNPDRFGHVWTSPEVAAYTGMVTNRGAAAVTGKVVVSTRSYDGSEKTMQEKAVTVPAGKSVPVKFSLPVKLHGYHEITATLDMNGKAWTEQRSFVRLAPDTRSARWTEGKGAMFGYWSYHGGHYTPKADHHVRLMTLAGARASEHPPRGISAEVQPLMEKHWGSIQGTGYYVAPQPWAMEDHPDPAKIEDFKQQIMKNVDFWEKDTPQQFKPDAVYFFGEHHISSRLTAGNFPEYWGDPPFVYTEEEQRRLKMFMVTSRIAAEHYRKELPGRRILIGWGDPLVVVPMLRAGFPKELVDGAGLDLPNFERLPEMQLADNALHRLYELRTEFAKAGIPDPYLQYCEGIFVPTLPGSCSWREQMDIHDRWALISMAYGVKRFYSGWYAFDSGDYYGSEHYGGCGIQRRIPYCDPKPAYAAFATMTDKLNEANFDGWLKTGSSTTYCLRFKHEQRGPIYTLWTVRGVRPVTLTLAAEATVLVTDTMNNTKSYPSKNTQVTLTTDQSVIYVTGAEVLAVAVGEPNHADARPAAGAKPVADLGDGSWKYTAQRREYYENNHWGFYPAQGKFSATVAQDPTHGKVLLSKLEQQARVRELMPWYSTLAPAKPITLPYAPSHVGLWVKGHSDWGRVIYVLRDAKGERWTSIGTKDDYNCNDIHAWSSFNFDGWRYLRFELPGHLGYDNFRKQGATWWRADFGDGVVDLPLKLEEIIVEQRSHLLYVNDVQPAAADTVAFGKLYVEYAVPQDATEEAVRQSRLRMPLPPARPNLPNPIAELARDGVGAAAKAITLTPPEHYYDGTRMHVHFAEVPGAKAYFLWVGPYPDGRGAVNLVPAGVKNGQLITGLRPGIMLYYWLCYTDADGKMSKPSPVHAEMTVDNFKEK